MTDAGGDDVQVAPAPVVASGPMDKEAALKAVLHAAAHADGLAKGLHETCKALDKREALFCVLAENCDEPQYVKLVEVLCAEHDIPLIKVADKKIIGEYVGLCRYDKEGKARKVVGCSSAVVKSWGNETQGRAVLQEYFNSKK